MNRTKKIRISPENLKVLIISGLTVLAVILLLSFRKKIHIFPTAGRETIVSKITVSDISPTNELKVMTIYKEILVGMTKKDQSLPGAADFKIYAIFPAKLQLGFDLGKCRKDWIRASGDTVYVTMPPIEILNSDGQFVDEAARQVPIQTGPWSAEEMNELKALANKKMLLSCEEEGCRKSAAEQGKIAVADLMRALGCKNVVVTVRPEDPIVLEPRD